MKTVVLLAVALVVAVALAAPPPALAYDYDSCLFGTYTWNGSTQTFGASTVSFPVGSWVRFNLDQAVAGWNTQAPGGNFRFNLVADSASSFSLGDDKNSIFFNSTYDFDGALAVTRTRRNCFFVSRITEADVLFNTAFSWTFDPAPATPPSRFSPYNFNLVAIHELGHAFGLQHSNGVMATMNECYPNGGPIGASQIHPHADDVAGDRAGYGTSGSPRDLAASIYERLVSGNCAATSDRIVPPSTAYRGVPASFKFTIENRGTQTQSPAQVSYYLSADRNVTTSDVFLGSANFSLAAGSLGTYTATVTVPVSTTPGSYFFGWIIDPGNAVAEVNEGNNAGAMAFATTVPSFSPPTACFTASPTFGAAPLLVQVNAGCSSDPDGGTLSYFWNFGDGTAFSGGAQQSHWYYAEGPYTITLTVTDPQGHSSVATRNVLVTCGGIIICPEL